MSSSSNFSRSLDRFMRKLNRDIARISSRAEQLLEHATAAVTPTRNRVRSISVKDDNDREVGLITRTADGWNWSGHRLNSSGQASGREQKLPDALRALMRHLHGL